ncbi:MAG: phosphohistidine phosphatase SixA [Marinagarivorans sp.]|nr:phosphohistidine phosphatase SixA [Marinagarivorans sp.]
MQLFLLRHGHAVAHAASDSERPLSELGRADIRINIAAIANELSTLEAVWVSPYLRAQQTWQEAKTFLPKAPNSINQDAITPDGNLDEVITLLAQANVASLLLVTHQTFVGDLMDYLCGFEPGQYFMDTADVVAIDLPDIVSGVGELCWHRKAHP